MARREDISKLPQDMRELINLATRHAAVEIMNDLADAGPEWSGDFQDSWVAVPVGTGASGSTGGMTRIRVIWLFCRPTTSKRKSWNMKD